MPQIQTTVVDPSKVDLQGAVAAAKPAAPVRRKAAKSAVKKTAANDWPHPQEFAPEQAAASPTKSAVAKKAPAAKTVVDKAVKRAKAAGAAAKKAPKAPKVEARPVEATKPVKVKLVRDSFTIPASEYAVLATLKQRALVAAHPVKKSELLRAGIQLLAALSDTALMAALKNVPAIKTGRPKGKNAA